MVEQTVNSSANDSLDISPDAVRFFYDNNEAFRRLWQAYLSAGQRLNVLSAMPSAYIQVETEMVRRRRSALAEQITDLVRRRQASWQISRGSAKTTSRGGSVGNGRLHPGNAQASARAWSKAEG